MKKRVSSFYASGHYLLPARTGETVRSVTESTALTARDFYALYLFSTEVLGPAVLKKQDASDGPAVCQGGTFCIPTSAL